MNDGKAECTFLWFIENYSYCWHKNKEKLISPEFTVDGFEGTVWILLLYPRWDQLETKDGISLYLKRCKIDDGPEDFSVKFELSILAQNGLPKSRNTEHSFKKANERGWGWRTFLQRDEALLHRKADYLPRDTLSVRCKMWKGQGNVRVVTEITARTRIGIERISFLHLIESFSTLQPNEKKSIEIRSPLNKRWTLTSSLYFIEDSSGGKIIMEFTPSDQNRILAKCKISLQDKNGKKTECGEADNRLKDTIKDIQTLPLSISRQIILNKESNYLRGDNLSLSCECVFSNGVEYAKIERTIYEKPLKVYYEISNKVHTEGIPKVAKKFPTGPNALEDLKTVYKDQLLTDVELKTQTKSFPAHKICLCARSPVFRNMLTSEMKEKNSSVILIDDLEDDTLQQFLLFLYTDELEDLCWESAIKLYYAADKYQTRKLKEICSSFLVDNINVGSASELLILADRHRDLDLKEAVEDFILRHEEEVFTSEEWEKLSEVNPRLANKTMLLKYKRK